MLSLCMIVKDESESLENCLSKVANFVDEIVIVDTGSTDRTKNIAIKFTDKIYDFEWCSDFAKARNFALSKTTSDWVLVLDADELVEEFNKKKIQNFIRDSSNETKVGRLKRNNIMEDQSGTKKYRERVNRLFNKNYFKYDGIIHEQIVAMNNEKYETVPIDITVNHNGYTEKVVNRTDKLNRNIDLLKTAIKSNAEDPYLYFQLGKSYYMLKDYKTAVLYFEKALAFDLDFTLEYVKDLVETYGYSLINSGRYIEALVIENCKEIYKKSSDFHFLMGLIYMNNANFDSAVRSFIKCTEFDDSNIEGLNSYIAWYNIGVIYEMLGYREKARYYYDLCGKYEPARKRLNCEISGA